MPPCEVRCIDTRFPGHPRGVGLDTFTVLRGASLPGMGGCWLPIWWPSIVSTPYIWLVHLYLATVLGKINHRPAVHAGLQRKINAGICIDRGPAVAGGGPVRRCAARCGACRALKGAQRVGQKLSANLNACSGSESRTRSTPRARTEGRRRAHRGARSVLWASAYHAKPHRKLKRASPLLIKIFLLKGGPAQHDVNFSVLCI